MKNWKCIIIDDEEHAVGLLEEMILKIPGLEVIQTFEDGLSALNVLRDNEQVDLIFSDIDMPGLNGIEAAKILKAHCKYLIYVTAHGKYALEAHDVHADGYLLKPLSLSGLVQKVEYLKEKERLNTILKRNEPLDEHFFVKAGHKGTFIKIVYKDVVCIDSSDHYVFIVTKFDKIFIYMTMKEIEAHLDKKSDFVRISKSCIISFSFLLKTEGNRVHLQHATEKIRDIGETYRKSFLKLINTLVIFPGKKQ